VPLTNWNLLLSGHVTLDLPGGEAVAGAGDGFSVAAREGRAIGTPARMRACQMTVWSRPRCCPTAARDRPCAYSWAA